jgi:hypothetical protein
MDHIVVGILAEPAAARSLQNCTVHFFFEAPLRRYSASEQLKPATWLRLNDRTHGVILRLRTRCEIQPWINYSAANI